MNQYLHTQCVYIVTSDLLVPGLDEQVGGPLFLGMDGDGEGRGLQALPTGLQVLVRVPGRVHLVHLRLPQLDLAQGELSATHSASTLQHYI